MATRLRSSGATFFLRGLTGRRCSGDGVDVVVAVGWSGCADECDGLGMVWHRLGEMTLVWLVSAMLLSCSVLADGDPRWAGDANAAMLSSDGSCVNSESSEVGELGVGTRGGGERALVSGAWAGARSLVRWWPRRGSPFSQSTRAARHKALSGGARLLAFLPPSSLSLSLAGTCCATRTCQAFLSSFRAFVCFFSRTCLVFFVNLPVSTLISR